MKVGKERLQGKDINTHTWRRGRDTAVPVLHAKYNTKKITAVSRAQRQHKEEEEEMPAKAGGEGNMGANLKALHVQKN